MRAPRCARPPELRDQQCGHRRLTEIAEGTESAFDELIATDLKGLFFCLKHEIKAMRKGGGGAILNMSSVTSSITAARRTGFTRRPRAGSMV